MRHDEGGLVGRIAQLTLDPHELGFTQHAGGFVDEIEGVEQDPVHLGAGDGGDVLVRHVHRALGVGRRRADDGIEEVVAVVVVAEGAVNLNGLLAQRLDAVGEGDVVFRFAIEVGAVTVDDETEGLLADLEHLIGAAAQIFSHAGTACDERFVLSDVGVGKQDPDLLRNLQRGKLTGE